MKYVVTINGKNFEVEVEKGEATVAKISESAVTNTSNSKSTDATNLNRVEEPKKQSSAAGEKVECPMPGVILDIKVSKGSSVKKGDVLVILEAMKMENEITATKDGIVSEIAVSKGASVSTGDLLAVIS